MGPVRHTVPVCSARIGTGSAGILVLVPMLAATDRRQIVPRRRGPTPPARRRRQRYRRVHVDIIRVFSNFVVLLIFFVSFVFVSFGPSSNANVAFYGRAMAYWWMVELSHTNTTRLDRRYHARSAFVFRSRHRSTKLTFRLDVAVTPPDYLRAVGEVEG